MELFELIQTLTAAYGPAGDEGEIRDLIAGLAQPYADEITTEPNCPQEGERPQGDVLRPHGLHRLHGHPG